MIPRISPGQNVGRFWRGDCGFHCREPGFRAFRRRTKCAAMNWIHAVILGVLLSVTAVIGDLIESLFKREAGAEGFRAISFPASAACSTCSTAFCLTRPSCTCT